MEKVKIWFQVPRVLSHVNFVPHSALRPLVVSESELEAPWEHRVQKKTHNERRQGADAALRKEWIIMMSLAVFRMFFLVRSVSRPWKGRKRNPIEARENAFSVDINENFIECADALSYCRVVSIVDEFQEERKKKLPASNFMLR